MAPQTRAHRLCLLALLWACAEPPELAQQQLQIINGEPSVAGAFPTVGALLATVQTYQGPRGGFSCTGTLIAPDVVLTAGHCIEPPQGVQEMTLYFSLSLDVADFGQPDLTLPPRTSRVRRAQPHPGWQGTQSLQPRGLGQPNDLALLFLETPFLDAPTSILSDPLGAATLRRDASVLIVGYGQRDPEAGDMMGPQPPAGVQYQAWSVIKEISAVEMQIGDEFPTPQKCHGDSGGPTFMDFDDGRAPSRRLIGVTSRGYEDSADCWIGGVDTRVDYYHAWISEAMVNACRDGTRAGCVEGGAPPIPEVTPPDVGVEPDAWAPQPDAWAPPQPDARAPPQPDASAPASDAAPQATPDAAPSSPLDATPRLGPLSPCALDTGLCYDTPPPSNGGCLVSAPLRQSGNLWLLFIVLSLARRGRRQPQTKSKKNPR